jgi:hypothetical protein
VGGMRAAELASACRGGGSCFPGPALDDDLTVVHRLESVLAALKFALAEGQVRVCFVGGGIL